MRTARARSSKLSAMVGWARASALILLTINIRVQIKGRAMRRSLRLESIIAMTLAAFVACGCTEHGSQLIIQVKGTPAATAGREARFTAVGGTAGPWMGPPFAQSFCATDQEAFLSTPIRVEIREGATVLADIVVERFACALSNPESKLETITMTLDEVGTLYADFDPGGPLAFAGCGESEGVICSTPELR